MVAALMDFHNQVRKYRRTIARTAASLLLLALFFYPGFSGPVASDLVSAQDNTQAAIAPPDTSLFPKIKTTLDVYDGQGQFVHGLVPGEVTVIEDGQPAKVDTIQEVEPGVCVIVAINAGLPLAIRDLQGKTRFQAVAAALQAWIEARDNPGKDVYSLVGNSGTLADYETDPAAWLSAFQNYQPDMRSATPSLDSLNKALAMAGDPTPKPGMNKAILYITPPPDETVLNGLAGLSEQVKQTGAHLFIWMVGSPADFNSQGAASLAQLATDSGGQFFGFSGIETLPDIATYFEPLGYSYELTYKSTLNSSGSHTLMVKINHESFAASTSEQPFSLDIKPPSPMFLSPPAQVDRRILDLTATPAAGLIPERQTLQIMVEFPDGHKRGLAYTRLYVDGELEAENDAAPFDKFTWDLTGYTASGRHLLTVEVQDSLGLTTMSSGTPVEVVVTLPQKPGTFDAIGQVENLLPIAGLVTAGPALLVLLVVLWRRRHPPKTRPAGRRVRSQEEEAALASNKPGEPGMQPGQMPARPGVSRARLVRLGENNQKPLAGNPIRIGAGDTCLGRDPSLANCPVNEASVETLHARIRQERDGNFIIFDQGSTAGTWVNYEPVLPEGTRLEHGDLVHAGKVLFRFELDNPARIRKLEIVRLKKGHDPF